MPTSARIKGREGGREEETNVGKREREGERGRPCMGIEKRRSWDSRVDVCTPQWYSRTTVPVRVYPCVGRVESRSESGANWSRLVCPISLPCAPTFDRSIPRPYLPPPIPLARSIALSSPLSSSPSPPCSTSISPTSLTSRLAYRFGTIRDPRLNPHHFGRWSNPPAPSSPAP